MCCPLAPADGRCSVRIRFENEIDTDLEAQVLVPPGGPLRGAHSAALRFAEARPAGQKSRPQDNELRFCLPLRVMCHTLHNKIEDSFD